jgi:hypothetical protein
MTRVMGIFMGLFILAAVPAIAQETTAGPGALEVTIVPGGGTFFTAQGRSPSFGNYDVGAGVAYNFSRWVGVEAEVGGTLGISQNLSFSPSGANTRTPDILTYTGNVIVNAVSHSPIVPYVTGGIGGLTMADRPEFGVNGTQTFLTGNAGGGLKWYAPNGRWGLRGDYRFIAVRANDNAPAFFGQQTQYGHRVYAAFIINAVR